jgi:hypothetical protein
MDGPDDDLSLVDGKDVGQWLGFDDGSKDGSKDGC